MKTKTYNCPVEAAVDVFGGKWKALILWWLQERTWRFAELRRQIPGITEKMLTQQLRELQLFLFLLDVAASEVHVQTLNHQCLKPGPQLCRWI